MRQMSITESFKKAKISAFRMKEQFLVSDTIISIDSDDDDDESSPFIKQVSVCNTDDTTTPITQTNSTTPIRVLSCIIMNKSTSELRNAIPSVSRKLDFANMNDKLIDKADLEYNATKASSESFMSQSSTRSEHSPHLSPSGWIGKTSRSMKRAHTNTSSDTSPIIEKRNKTNQVTPLMTSLSTSKATETEQGRCFKLVVDKQRAGCSKLSEDPIVSRGTKKTPNPESPDTYQQATKTTNEISTPSKENINTQNVHRPVDSQRKFVQKTLSFHSRDPVQTARPENPKSSTTNEPIALKKNCVESFVAKNVDTRIPTVVEHQKPCCSKSDSVMSPSGKSPSKTFGNGDKSPSRKKLSPSVRSPSKRSPVATREIKNLKAKEGKQLQSRHLVELINSIEYVIGHVHLGRLISAEEQSVLTCFMQMKDEEKYFVMKLFVWQRNWYNIYQFRTKAQLVIEDDAISGIFDCLKRAQFVDTEFTETTDLTEILNALEKSKLECMMKELKIKPNKGKKEELIQTIQNTISTQPTITKGGLRGRVLKLARKNLGFTIKIKEHVFNTFRHCHLLATFANRDLYDIQEFFRKIIVDRVVFPQVNIDVGIIIFPSRKKFLEYAEALDLSRTLDDLRQNKAGIYELGRTVFKRLRSMDRDDNTPSISGLRRFSAEHVYCSILSTCCDLVFTKQSGNPEKVKLWLEYLIKRFPDSRRLGHWYCKLIWQHMRHLSTISHETGAELLIKALRIKGLNDKCTYELAQLGNKLKSKVARIYHDRIMQLMPRSLTPNLPEIEIDSLSMRSNQSGRKRTYLTRDSDSTILQGVENVALHYYKSNGYPNGGHYESSLMNALTVLYFWDVIYMPDKVVPGSFVGKFQTAPLDMFSTDFYRNRKEQIDQRLMQIGSIWSEEEIIALGSKSYDDHSHEYAVFGEVMRVITEKVLIEHLVKVIGGKVLAKIFERLIKNLGECKSGMPDLLVWSVDERKHKFVEVKGEGDRLSIGQTLWLDYLQRNGASVEVCWVHSLGSKKKLPNKNRSPKDTEEPSVAENEETNEASEDRTTLSF